MACAIAFDNINFMELNEQEQLFVDGGSVLKVLETVAAGVAIGVAVCATVLVVGAVVAACIAVSPAAAAVCIGTACSCACVASTSAAIGYGLTRRVF